MSHRSPQSCTAFVGHRRVAAGDVRAVATAVKQLGAEQPGVLVFDDATSEPVELDLRGTLEEVLGRLPPAAPEAEAAPPRTPGRPKLGVVGREVTLLPRHWDWLASQPGGASVALRKLVEAASRANEATDRRRRAQEAAYRFMSAVAGNLPDYEEATRALFADDADRFTARTEGWPPDVRDHARALARRAFEG